MKTWTFLNELICLNKSSSQNILVFNHSMAILLFNKKRGESNFCPDDL